MPRHFLRDDDLTPAEQATVLDLADAMKKDRFGYPAALVAWLLDQERYAKPTRECRPLGPARGIGAGAQAATTAGPLHNANFFIRHQV